MEPPVIVHPNCPVDMTVENDGNGNTHDIAQWLDCFKVGEKPCIEAISCPIDCESSGSIILTEWGDMRGLTSVYLSFSSSSSFYIFIFLIFHFGGLGYV